VKCTERIPRKREEERNRGRRGSREQKEQQVADSWSFLALHIGQRFFVNRSEHVADICTFYSNINWK